MPSMAYTKFSGMLTVAKILGSFSGQSSLASPDQTVIGEACRKAAVAAAVGCWEGYIEAVLREFVSKVRVQTHRRNWTLIAQFEVMVDKKVSSLNTPNWDQARNLLIEITGTDPYSAWVWQHRFNNPNDTKNYFDGVMNVRHAFAHGFAIPHDVPGLTVPGVLDDPYVSDVINCLDFFAVTTETLLEHELRHRHSCQAGWN